MSVGRSSWPVAQLDARHRCLQTFDCVKFAVWATAANGEERSPRDGRNGGRSRISRRSVLILRTTAGGASIGMTGIPFAPKAACVAELPRLPAMPAGTTSGRLLPIHSHETRTGPSGQRNSEPRPGKEKSRMKLHLSWIRVTAAAAMIASVHPAAAQYMPYQPQGAAPVAPQQPAVPQAPFPQQP